MNDDLYFAVLAQDADGGSECTLAREIAERSGVATDLVPATATDFVQLPAKMIAELGDGVGDLSFDRLDAVEILPGVSRRW